MSASHEHPSGYSEEQIEKLVDQGVYSYFDLGPNDNVEPDEDRLPKRKRPLAARPWGHVRDTEPGDRDLDPHLNVSMGGLSEEQIEINRRGLAMLRAELARVVDKASRPPVHDREAVQRACTESWGDSLYTAAELAARRAPEARVYRPDEVEQSKLF